MSNNRANLPLTARQEAFCQEFVRTRNLRNAYAAAYNSEAMAEGTVHKRAREVFDTQVVKDRIAELIDLAAAPTVFTVSEALARFLAIAAADPNELVSLKVGACRYCHGDLHAYQWREREYLEALDRAERINEERRLASAGPKGAAFKEEPYPDVAGGFGYDATREPHPFCPECHGEGVHRIVAKDTDMLSPEGRLLFGGVKHTANGPQIVIADRMKALEYAARIIGAFQDNANVKISAEMKAMVATVTAQASNPQQAAQMYQDMIAGKLASG